MIPGLDHCFKNGVWYSSDSADGKRILSAEEKQKPPSNSIATPITQVAIDSPETLRAKRRSEWLEAQAAYYLKLIQNLLDAGIREKESGFPDEALQRMRRYEIKRLSQMRDRILEQLEEC